ncbi:MAG: hypothetical protein ACLPHP_14975 [Candidatus Sulfotelmatobacter sp.]
MKATEPKGRQIVFKDEMQPAEFAVLVESLMNDGVEFAFYDVRYPSPSDPGAYFKYSPMNGVWRMTLGNHGWSGGIYEIESEVLINQLQNLHKAGVLKSLDIEKVYFSSHYQPESAEKNDAMNTLLRKIHT